MKINFILPFIDLAGGVKSTFEVAKRLQYRNHKVKIYYPKYKNLFRRKCNLKVTTMNIVKPLLGRGRIFNFDTNLPLIQVPIFHNRFLDDADAIIGTWWEDIYPMMNLSGSKGRKYHFIRHYEIWGGTKEKVDRVYNFKNDKIVNSTWLQKLVEEKFNQTPRLCLNGLDTTQFYYSSSKKTLSNNNLIVGIMYRPSWKWKGIEEALAVLDWIWNHHKNHVTFILFGEKVERTLNFPYKNIVRPFGDEIRKIYDSLDIFLYTSHSEGFANPPLEAMACRTAVISTKVGGVTDYGVDGENIIQVEPGDIDTMIRKIEILIDDHRFRDKLSKKAEIDVKQFSWEETTDTLEKILQE